MLPALPQIGAELAPEAVNRAQLVITSFVFGMGVGTFLVGPLSDAFGRKPVVLDFENSVAAVPGQAVMVGLPEALYL